MYVEFDKRKGSLGRMLAAAAPLAMALVLGASPAEAIVVTQTFFSDRNGSFTWDFEWDGVIGDLTRNATRGAQDAKPGVQWRGGAIGGDAPAVRFIDGPRADTIDFAARHVVRCHETAPDPDCVPDGIDSLMGDPFQTTIISIAELVVTETDMRLPGQPPGSGVVDHLHNPEPDHSDSYAVFYRKPAAAGGKVFFSFTGVHLGRPKPAPEPSTLAVLAVGLLGLLQYARRRSADGRA